MNLTSVNPHRIAPSVGCVRTHHRSSLPARCMSTRKRTRDHAATHEDIACCIQRLKEGLEGEDMRPVSTKFAAVLVPLFSDAAGVVRVVLTQRSSKLPTHQGEVCLPGGKRDPGDADDVATALREANEELGLDPSKVTVLGQLRPFLSKHFLSVAPVIARVPAERDQHAPSPNSDEVAAVFDVPLSVFLGTQGHTSRDITWLDHQYRIHYFDHGGFNIWGLTASILINVAKVALGREPDFKEHAPRGSEYTRFWHDGQQLRVHRVGSPAASQEQAQPVLAAAATATATATATSPAAATVSHTATGAALDVGTAAWQHAHSAAAGSSSQAGSLPAGVSILMGSREGKDEVLVGVQGKLGAPSANLSSTEMPPQPGAGVPKESML